MNFHFITFKIKGISLSLFFILIAYSLSAQVSGTVTDDTGFPLPGVNILIKEKNGVGTVTDIDGKYSIDAQTGETLIFKFLGFADIEKVISGATIDVNMSEDSELLDEVVIIGYGAVQKDDLTGVVQKVSEDDFIQASISSPEKLINGKVAGLQVSSNGEPGGATELKFRGPTSLRDNTPPLVVIDGVPVDHRQIVGSRNPFNFVNARDIADVTILKDASAAAIYGARAANGVIIITTKSGQTGRPKVEYTANFNMSQFSGSPTNLSPDNFRNAILAKAPQDFEFLGEENVNWFDEVTQLGRSMEHSLAVGGGTKKIDYRLSGTFIRSNGVLINSQHQKTALAANINTKLFKDNLHVSVRSKLGLTDDTYTPDVVGSALSFDPTRSVLEEGSPYGGYFEWNDILATTNPVSTIMLQDFTGKSVRTLNNLKLEYHLPFIEGLSVTSNLSYDKTDGTKRNFSDPLYKSQVINATNGNLSLDTIENTAILAEHYATYTTKLGTAQKSSFTFTGGHAWQDFQRRQFFEFGNQLMEENGDYIYTENIKQDSINSHNRIISFFGRANLNLSEKYLITASLRRDGSSRFGPDNRWGLFPSAAVAWRILEEDWAEGLNGIFTDLKLRVSYGITGDESIPDFLYATFYSVGTADAAYQFGDEFVQTLRPIGVDPNIKWERTTSQNIGLDYGFWNNRISGSLELYRKYTDDLIAEVAAPAFTNLSDLITTNIGEMKNTGVELVVDTRLMDRKHLDWDLGFNISFNDNEIMKLDNRSLDDLSEFQGYEIGGISGDIGQTIQILRVGETNQTFLTYNHLRDASGQVLPDGKDHNGDGIADDIDIYEDINADGLINEKDLVVQGSALPKLIMGLSTGVDYKNWSLSATCRSHLGNKVYNNVASSTGYYERLSDRKTNNIDISAFDNDFTQKQLKSNVYIEDASFFKLDNVSLNYNVPVKKFFNTLSLQATVSNLFTITKYSGLDPELPQFNRGIDNNIYPISRNFLLGINASF